MENSIRQNIYAIVVISFCIGILYGLRAHAGDITPATKMSCGDAKKSAAQEIPAAKALLAKEDAFNKAGEQIDDAGLARGREQFSAVLENKQHGLQASVDGLSQCGDDAEAQKDLSDISKINDQIGATLGRVKGGK